MFHVIATDGNTFATGPAITVIFAASAKTSAVAAEAMGTVIENFTQGTGFYRNPVAADFF